MIKASNNPFECTPAIIGNSEDNELVYDAGFSLVGQNLTMNAGWQWKINLETFTNPSPVIINIPFASTGKQRIDRIVATVNNTFIRVYGTESVSNPVAPSIPNDTVEVTFFTVNDGAIDEPSEPIIGSLYVQKEESQEITLSGSGVIGAVDMTTLKSCIRFTGTVTELNSIQRNGFLRQGQIYRFINAQTATTVVLGKLVSSGNLKFKGIHSLLPGEQLFFTSNVNTMELELVGLTISDTKETILQSRWLFSDFLVNNTNQYPFLGLGIASGTVVGIYSPTTPDGHLGNAVIASSTSANSGYRYIIETQGIRNQQGLTFFSSFSLLSNSDARDRVIRLGFIDQSTSTTPTMGAYLEITGFGAVFKTVASSVTTSSSSATLSSSTIAAGIFYNILIEFLTTTSVKCKLVRDNGTVELEVTHTTNIPLTSDRFGCGIVAFIVTAGSAHQICAIDYMGFGQAKPNFLNSF